MVETVIYVRNVMFATPSADEAFDLAIFLSMNVRVSYVEAPSELCIRESQYKLLPENLKRFFVKKTVHLRRIP